MPAPRAVRPSIVLITTVLGLCLSACLSGAEQRPVVITTQAIPADLPPSLTEVPSEPNRTVEMQPGPEAISDEVVAWLERQPGYIPGSGTIAAVYPGDEGPVGIVSFAADNQMLGRVSCSSTGPLGKAPVDSAGCGGPPPAGPKQLAGVFYSLADAGPRSVTIEHSPDAQAVVLQLSDGDIILIRPGGVRHSMYQWVGSDLVRFTIFWPDGTTTEEIMTG